MAINKGTLAKKVNGALEYVYPKTSSDMIVHDGTRLNTILNSAELTDTTYDAVTGGAINLDSATNKFDLVELHNSTFNKGQSTDVTGSEGNTIKVPTITIDKYGRVTSLDESTYTSKDTTYSADNSTISLTGTTFSMMLELRVLLLMLLVLMELLLRFLRLQ